MPILGLTDRNAAFPEIGSIRKGQKETRQRENGKTFQVPIDLEYFRVEFDEREKEVQALFTKIYGPRPVEINILLPFDDIDRCFDTWVEAYLAGALIYRSDGERVLYEIDYTTGKRLVVNGEPHKPHRPNPLGTYKTEGGKVEPINAKPTGRLKVIIPELGRMAYMTVHTTSIHDISNLHSQLRAILGINGKLAGVPLKFRRRPQKISTPSGEGGKRARRAKWLLSIEADPEWVEKKLAEMHRLALPQPEAMILLAPPAPTTIPAEAGFSFDDDGENDDEDITDGDFTDAPPAPTTPKPTVETTGSLAAVTIPDNLRASWNTVCQNLADAKPHYRLETGKPNYDLIRQRAYAAGFTLIKADNYESAIEAISQG